MANTKPKRPIPFDFVFDELDGLNVHTKQMFGTHAIYIDDKIIFALREKETSVEDNGVWIATTVDHHDSLKKILPSMRSIKMFGTQESGWQVLPVDADDFEESVLKVCALVRKNDSRIGKVPKAKLKPKKKKTKIKRRISNIS